MKKITLLGISILLSIGVFAQVLDVIPMDPKVKFGKLENGLTYYVRSNKVPESRAEFYIVQRVGSMQEEDNQSGLAHFLEHMAFNGTTNFPKKEMLHYLESNGIKFGTNVNAYTSFDETVYNISDVPTTKQGLVDSCLLALYDWACGISLLDEEIDSERGVIREEWRTRGGSSFRLMEQLLPNMFKDSKYAKRLPIGSIDVINNFKFDEIRDYYKKWYRPDLQAIIVVGDFDAGEMEKRVKEMFSKMPTPVNPAKRISYEVPDNKDPLIAIATDAEATSISLNMYHKHDVLPDNIRNSTQGYIASYTQSIVSIMLNGRLSELLQKPEAPFARVGSYYGNYFISRAKQAFSIGAVCKENQILPSVKALQIEVERADKFGFTETEYERAKVNMLKMYENYYNNREKQRNSSYVREYTSNFVSGELVPGIEFEYDLLKKVAPNLPLALVNKAFKEMLRDDNIVISLTGPKKESIVYPTEKEILDALKEAKETKIEAFTEEIIDSNLIPVLPKAGKIVKKEKDKTFKDVSVWTLSNGMKVVLKTTDFKDDEILMTSSGEGGTSMFGDKDALNVKLLNSVYYVGGTGNFNSVNLRKALAGKTAGVSPNIGTFTQGVMGSSSIENFETLMQLTHLALSESRKDDEAFKAYVERLKSNLKNQEAEPSTAFVDSITRELYGDNIHRKQIKYADIDGLNYDRMLEMYKEAFSDKKNQTFIFVGNIDEAKIQPYIETYLASLPAGKDVKKGKFTGLFVSGNKNNTFAKKMENPKASIYNAYLGNLDYTLKNRLTMNFVSQILNILYQEKIREEEGGTYGVNVGGNISRDDKNQALLQISFDTDPERISLNEKVIEIFEDLSSNVRDDDFNKSKEYILKSQQQQERENSFWRSILSSYFNHNEDDYSNYLQTLNSITKDDVKNMAKKINKFSHKIVIMKPE